MNTVTLNSAPTCNSLGVTHLQHRSAMHAKTCKYLDNIFSQLTALVILRPGYFWLCLLINF